MVRCTCRGCVYGVHYAGDVPASKIRIYFEQRGGHVHCRVFGPEDGKSGDLVFRVSEWPLVQSQLSLIADLRNEGR